tara:strand:+ start:3894 stop:5306 length:1413 start_codon:yes stop_codon:yes gene_type:complete
MSLITNYLLIFICLIINNLSIASDAIKTKLDTNQNVSTKILKNGMKIIVKTDSRSPIFVSQIWYKVGSSYETNGITGISHMLEHMMFKESKNLKDGEFTKIIDTNGGVQNAFTAQDFTAYYEVLRNDKLSLALKLEAERMRNLTLNEKAFEKEKQVVLEERRMRVDDKPYSHLYERLLAASYISNPYHHPVIGWPEDIKQYNIDNIKSWYNKWYHPNNAVLVVVGDVNPKKVFNLAEKYFGKIPKKTPPKLKTRTEIKPLGRKEITAKLNAKVPMLMMSFLTPNLTNITDNNLNSSSNLNKIQNFKEALSLEIIAALLSNDNSSRLPKNLVRDLKIATSAGAEYDSFGLHKSLFILHGIPNANIDIKKLEKALLTELNIFKTNKVSTKELTKIQNQIIASKVYGEDDISNQAIQIGSLESINISWKFYDIYLQELQKITADNILATAKKYFIEDNLTVAYLNPVNDKTKL